MITFALTLIAFLIIAVFALWTVIVTLATLSATFFGDLGGKVLAWTMLTGTLFLWWIGLH
jgi:hypothetical protein